MGYQISTAMEKETAHMMGMNTGLRSGTPVTAARALLEKRSLPIGEVTTMHRKRTVLLMVTVGVVAAAVAIGAILTTRSGPAQGKAVFVDTVPTVLPSEGVRIEPVANILLMPSTADAETLIVSSAEEAIAKAPDNDIPKNARAILADVTIGDIPADTGIENRPAWIVTYEYEKLHEVPRSIPIGAPEPPPWYAHGQVSIIDAKTGQFLIGFYLMEQ